MKQFASFVLACFVCFCLLIATERRALAYYVDPGSGLLALQSAASALAAIGFFMRRKIRALFSKKPAAAASALVTAQKGNARKAA
jgi:hypothetical protein